jgi:hypothetical protein
LRVLSSSRRSGSAPLAEQQQSSVRRSPVALLFAELRRRTRTLAAPRPRGASHLRAPVAELAATAAPLAPLRGAQPAKW